MVPNSGYNDSCKSDESPTRERNALHPRVAWPSCQASRCAFEGRQTTDESLITQQEDVATSALKGQFNKTFVAKTTSSSDDESPGYRR